MNKDNEIYQQLEDYWRKHQKRRCVQEKLVVKASSIFNSGYKNSGLMKCMFQGIKMLICLLIGSVLIQTHKSQNKRYLRKRFKLQSKEIAMDENDLLEHKERIRCYGDTFTYSVVTSKSYLRNIEVIFGDAHLEALDDISCLASLVKVAGDVYYKGKRYTDLSEIK